MEALFIVPTLVSEEINPRLVAPLCKAVERNIVLLNSSSFRIASIKKYGSILLHTSRRESVDFLSEADPKTSYDPTFKEREDERKKDRDEKFKNTASEVLKRSQKILNPGGKGKDGKPSLPGSDEKPGESRISNTKDFMELPRGITFFGTISLEPTFLEIPLQVKTHMLSTATSSRIVRIGVKCVPYTVDGVRNIVEMMKNTRSNSDIKNYFSSKWNSIQKSIPFSSEREIYKGKLSGNIERDIFFSPSLSDLSNTSKLSRLMNSRKPANWSIMCILSTRDFEEDDMNANIRNYRTLAESGWGDICIVNEVKESAYFCLQKMMTCQEFPFTYLKNVMKLDNVLDYQDTQRFVRPFGSSSFRTAFSENETLTENSIIPFIENKLC